MADYKIANENKAINEAGYSITSYKDLRKMTQDDTDELSMFLIDLDEAIQLAWQSRKKNLTYLIPIVILKFKADISNELWKKGYTFRYILKDVDLSDNNDGHIVGGSTYLFIDLSVPVELDSEVIDAPPNDEQSS